MKARAIKKSCFITIGEQPWRGVRHHKDTETQGGRSNRGTDIEIRFLISLSVPESSSIAPASFVSLCLCCVLSPYVVRKSHGCERTNHIPSDVDLPPMTAEACRRRLRMVIAVPVFTPRCHLKRA